ncbi:hypothetical protein INR77_09105 [Erythrobacter sp. SCSIO 43205]|uniref:hypothetical protein n=1 Tax=Erythrobacter sp. SCSIO 43205 TaxID=2779361 RepID=UPI001CA8EA02|nr:hypothetical protein [Erythrobacter sp. SCSIO 43205]UAB77004.1 hypothetical protein INR77_09105 [Erythrobacter sp. SCSIO 43205]
MNTPEIKLARIYARERHPHLDYKALDSGLLDDTPEVRDCLPAVRDELTRRANVLGANHGQRWDKAQADFMLEQVRAKEPTQ